MKHFELDSSMTTMQGVFYPTGYMVVMFPTQQDAMDAARKLDEDGFPGDKVALLTPAAIQEKIARTVGNTDITMPSAGTEADTVRRFAQLAGQGHHGLVIHSPHGEETAHIMELLDGAPVSYAQKYRQLVIEDLV
jgi:hypothetical protein